MHNKTQPAGTKPGMTSSALVEWRAMNDSPGHIAAFMALADAGAGRALQAFRNDSLQGIHVADLRRHRSAVTAFAHKINDSAPRDQKLPKQSADALDAALALVHLIDEEIESAIGGSPGVNQMADGSRGRGTTGEFVDPASGRPLPVAYASRGLLSEQLAPMMASLHDEPCSLADFMRGVAGARTTESVKAAMSTGTDSAGGYMLPAFVQRQVLDAMVPVSSLLTAGAGVVLLEEGAKSYRAAAVNAIPAAAWRAEAGAIAESDPTFRNVDLVPRSLAFRFKVSRELLMDAANIDQVLVTTIAQAFAKELDRAGLRGSGTAPEIRGLLNTAGVSAVTNGANGASIATTAYANFVSAVNAILSVDCPMPTAAIMSPRTLTTLGGLLDTTNQPRGVPRMLEPMQMIATSQVPNNLTVGTSTDCSEIFVGDFSKLAYFFRERMSIQTLVEAHATTGEIGFVGHVRADLGVLYPAAFAIVTGVRA